MRTSNNIMDRGNKSTSVVQRDHVNFNTLSKLALKDATKTAAGEGYVFNCGDFWKRLKAKCAPLLPPFFFSITLKPGVE